MTDDQDEIAISMRDPDPGGHAMMLLRWGVTMFVIYIVVVVLVSLGRIILRIVAP